MSKNTGAEWEIAVDGKPRSHRDDREVAREAGRYLKKKSPNSEVTVKNIVTGEVVSLGDV